MDSPAHAEAPTTYWSTDVIQSVWRGSRSARSAAHRAAGQGSCGMRTAPHTGATGGGAWSDCTAVGCADVFQELLVRVVARLTSRSLQGDLDRPAAWLARVVTNELSEIRRADRQVLGGPTKPGRTDGVPGRINAAIEESTDDPEVRAWRLTLFRLIRCYPYRDWVTSSRWPTEQWAVEKTKHGSRTTVLPAEIDADINTVLMVATRTAGAGWVYRTILEPMARRAAALEADQAAAGPDVMDRALLRLAAETFRRERLRGQGVATAWDTAMAAVGGASTCPTEWAVELLQSYANSS